MKRFLSLVLCLVIALSFSACGNDNSTSVTPTEDGANGEIIPNDVPAGSEADIAVRKAVSAYLDTFISCDFDAIKAAIHPDDMQYFNFDSEDQMTFYNTIFPQIKYKFEFVSEYEGVYGVMTEITSPDMAEVYGTIITAYIDSATGESNASAREIIENSGDRMIEMLKSPDLKRRVGRLYIYVEYIDG
ncbi:MAG: hypothetical protein IJ297_07275, partial [Clostridia bacterium]|nr:hypothetical protein [Clostridia bacterium]